MEFKSLKNIESSFRQIRLFSIVFLAEEALQAALTEENRKALAAFVEGIKALENFKAPEIYGVIKSVMEAQGIKMGPVATPLRVLVCGADKVPQIDKTLELFGKQTVLARIEEGLKKAGF